MWQTDGTTNVFLSRASRGRSSTIEQVISKEKSFCTADREEAGGAIGADGANGACLTQHSQRTHAEQVCFRVLPAGGTALELSSDTPVINMTSHLATTP